MSDSPSTSISTDSASSPADSGELARFEQVDWDTINIKKRIISVERIVFVFGMLAVAALFHAHRESGEVYFIFRWDTGYEDWLILASLVLLTAFIVVPLVRNWRHTVRLLKRFWGRWGTLLSLIVFATVLLVGIWAMLTGFRALIPWEVGIDTVEPPVWATKPIDPVSDCAGAVSGDGTICHGSWKYPLGTDSSGYKMTELLIMGTRPVVYATVLTIGIIVPLATIVGVVAGYYGGFIDDLLMAYVDIQLSFPAMLVYLVVFMFVLNSMVFFLIAFGLLSWGGIARIVRSETLQRREEGYVLTARSLGAEGPYIIRKHLIPNVTNTAIPAAFQLIAIIIVTEAGLSFLGFHPIDQSWGHTIQRGFTRASPISHWWVATLPAFALAITVVSCKLLGDGLRDILDPRGAQ